MFFNSLRRIHDRLIASDPGFRGYVTLLYLEVLTLIVGGSGIGCYSAWRHCFPPKPDPIVYTAAVFHWEHQEGEPCLHIAIVRPSRQTGDEHVLRTKSTSAPERLRTITVDRPERLHFRGFISTADTPGCYLLRPDQPVEKVNIITNDSAPKETKPEVRESAVFASVI